MIYLCQTEIAITGAARHFGTAAARRLVRDTDYLIKTALTETLAGAVLRPWALHAMRNGIATIVGYSSQSPDALNESRAHALPALQQVVGPMIGGPMPTVRESQHFAFDVRLSPMIHVTEDGARRHGERDAFLVAADGHSGERLLLREQVYVDYLKTRLVGAEIAAANLKGFRLNRMARKSAKTGVGQRVVPQAWIEGLLTVTEAARFEQTLIDGVGRQRAFGHGMIRLQPMRGQGT